MVLYVSPSGTRLYVQRYTLKKLCWQGLKASRTKLEWFGVCVCEKKKQGILKVNQLRSDALSSQKHQLLRSEVTRAGMCLYLVDNILLVRRLQK